jgi:hypothetical protein
MAVLIAWRRTTGPLRLCLNVGLNLGLGISLALSGALATSLTAQASDEAHVKAVFLSNFAKFVEWPQQTFKSSEDPLTICIFGPSAVEPALREIASRKADGERRLAVIRLAEGTTACQILFVSAIATRRAQAVLDQVRSRSILTVGESAGFAAGGGIINFTIEDGRVRFEINLKAAERAHVQVSSRLLSLAQIVKGNR